MKVPSYDNTQVAVATPRARAENAVTPQAVGIAGAQAQELGNAMQRAGAEAGRLFQGIQDEANATALNDAMNRALVGENALTANENRTGYQDRRGRDALPVEGVPLSKTYGEQWDTVYGDVRKGLANDAQRQQFDAWASGRKTSFTANVDRHASQQFDVYQDSTNDAAMVVGYETIQKQYADEATVLGAIGHIRGSALAKAKLAGQSEIYGDTFGREKVNKALTDVVKSLVDAGQIDAADAFATRYKDHFTDGGLAVRLVLDQEIELGKAQDAVSAVSMVAARSNNPSDFDRMVNITLQSESGNRDYNADGSVVTSTAGAKGKMQVMPGTKRNPGYGVRPAQSDSMEELARVGRDYLQAMLKRYGGDPAKAWAAYNGGPGTLDNALAKSPDNWLAEMPKETRDYVNKNVAALGGSGGRPKPVTELEFVDAAVAALGPNASPRLVEKTTSIARQRYAMVEGARKDNQEAGLSSAYDWLAQNPGATFYDMPASMRSQVPSDKIDSLISFSEKLASPRSQSDMGVYYTLSQNPDKLRDMSDSEFMAITPYLTPSDAKQFADERAAMRKGGGNNDPGNVDRASLNNTLGPRLAQLGINPKFKPNDQDAATHIGAIQKVVTDEVLARQRYLGRQLNSEEMTQTVDDIILKEVAFENTLFGMKVGALPSRRMVAVEYKDIPQGTVDRLVASLKRAGNPSPTKADILALYYSTRQ